MGKDDEKAKDKGFSRRLLQKTSLALWSFMQHDTRLHKLCLQGGNVWYGSTLGMHGCGQPGCLARYGAGRDYAG